MSAELREAASRVEKARDALARAEAARDAAIRAELEMKGGRGPTDIGRITGLSRTRIYQIAASRGLETG